MKRVCVFCGSNPGVKDAYLDAARDLASLLVRQGIGLVYGGAKRGLMGAIADATLAAGGEVIGVIPQALVDLEIAHHGVTDLRVVASMHERKSLMVKLSDGFIAMPGGYGTLDEFLEALTWGQLGMHTKPTALLNLDGYYDSLLALLDRAIEEKFVHPLHRAMVLCDADPRQLLTKMQSYHAPVVKKWLDRSDT